MKPTKDVTDVSNEATEISDGRLMISGAGGRDGVISGSGAGAGASGADGVISGSGAGAGTGGGDGVLFGDAASYEYSA